MDLHELDTEAMYFEMPLPAQVQALIDESSQHYCSLPLDGSADDEISQIAVDRAEWALLRAHLKSPEQLTVIVALYRFFYYRHRYTEALEMADRAILLSSRRLGLNEDWRALVKADLERAAARSMSSTRFLLLALKGAAWLLLRQDQPRAALERLAPIQAFDQQDQLGARELRAWAEKALRREEIANAGDNVHLIGD